MPRDYLCPTNNWHCFVLSFVHYTIRYFVGSNCALLKFALQCKLGFLFVQ